MSLALCAITIINITKSWCTSLSMMNPEICCASDISTANKRSDMMYNMEQNPRVAKMQSLGHPTFPTLPNDRTSLLYIKTLNSEEVHLHFNFGRVIGGTIFEIANVQTLVITGWLVGCVGFNGTKSL